MTVMIRTPQDIHTYSNKGGHAEKLASEKSTLAQ